MESKSCRDCESFAGPEVLSKSKLTPAIRGGNSTTTTTTITDNSNGKNNENWAEPHLGICVHFAQIRFDYSYTVECKLLLLLFVHNFFSALLSVLFSSLSLFLLLLFVWFRRSLFTSSLLLCVFFNLICMLLSLLFFLLLLLSCARFLYLSLPCSLAHFMVDLIWLHTNVYILIYRFMLCLFFFFFFLLLYSYYKVLYFDAF